MSTLVFTRNDFTHLQHPTPLYPHALGANLSEHVVYCYAAHFAEFKGKASEDHVDVIYDPLTESRWPEALAEERHEMEDEIPALVSKYTSP